MVAKRPHSLNMKEYNELELFWREFHPMDVSGSHGFDKHVSMLLMWIVRTVHILAKNILMLLFHGKFVFYEHLDDTTLAVWRNVMLCCYFKVHCYHRCPMDEILSVRETPERLRELENFTSRISI